jgi:hypothetical protein
MHDGTKAKSREAEVKREEQINLNTMKRLVA